MCLDKSGFVLAELIGNEIPPGQKLRGETIAAKEETGEYDLLLWAVEIKREAVWNYLLVV